MTTKKVLSKGEYLQLLGLKHLAEIYDSKLTDLNLAVRDILQETEQDGSPVDVPGAGWSGELIYTDRNVDEVLQILGVEVEK